MAQKAKKDLARANLATLKTLHLTSLALNAVFILSHFFLFPRHATTSLNLYLAFSLPAFVCQWILERAGRPSRDPTTGALRAAGDDLAAPGLMEYMFDVVWVTWGCDVLVMVFGDRMWWLWAAVPAFGVYKGWGLLGMARGLAGLGGLPGAGGVQGGPGGEQQGQGNRKQRRNA